METVLITGASGFIGKRLAKLFLLKGHHVTGLGTSENHPFLFQFPEFEWISADTAIEGEWQDRVAKSDIIINLAGRNIFHYWTKKYKKAIYNSRILTTRNLVNAIKKGKTKKFLTTSAVGIYGDCKEELLTEERASGKSFLADVCVDWEKEAQLAKEKDVKVAAMRFGVVLGDGGALSMMTQAFKLFAGGPLGSGQHWFPWIHIKDIEKAVEFLIDNKELEGDFNFVAPGLIRQKQFAKALGKALNRPAFMPAPSFVIKTIMGELGNALLESQKAVPEGLAHAGYNFLFEDVDSALKDILKK
jgi:uncharacterized protein